MGTFSLWWPMNAFDRALFQSSALPLKSDRVRTVQINLGLLCNLSCRHCHLQAGPSRTELMADATLDAVLSFIRTLPDAEVDLTGGAPEMHPRFRWLIEQLSATGKSVKVRTNLVILAEEDYSDLPEFLAKHRVALVASLPCYLQENVERQRGTGVFPRSIEVLKTLNRLGYGQDPLLPLALVFNPGGPALPSAQEKLETAYREKLRAGYGIEFTNLFTITNMPIGRFGDELRHNGEESGYRRLLAESFNPATLPGLMCRHQINIGWDGTLYDCDFNAVLDLPVEEPRTIDQADAEILAGRPVRTGPHCFACTAGAGSSCGGALT